MFINMAMIKIIANIRESFYGQATQVFGGWSECSGGTGVTLGEFGLMTSLFLKSWLYGPDRNWTYLRRSDGGSFQMHHYLHARLGT